MKVRDVPILISNRVINMQIAWHPVHRIPRRPVSRNPEDVYLKN